MLDINYLKENREAVTKNLKQRKASLQIDEVLELDQKRRQLIGQAEKLKAELNQMSKQKPDPQTIKKAKAIKTEIKKIEQAQAENQIEFKQKMMRLPNLTLEDVPAGQAGEIIEERGQQFEIEKPKDYLELAEKLDIIDVKRAAKVSGARFGYLKGGAVFLEFALINLALEILNKKDFRPVNPPVMLKPEAMEAMGYLDHHAEEIYFLPQDQLYLIGTSEQSIGAMHMNETFLEKELPKRYVGFSSCFRREAGSYGKDTKGIFRVHQFDKVEMFVFCKPEDSAQEHQLLLDLEKELLDTLKIPYRVRKLGVEDLGSPSAKTYDLECWFPGQKEFRETHSSSNCTDFQARRLNIKYKNKDNQTSFVHTLNGTAFAIGRTIIAIIENYQQPDGSIAIPQALQKYMPIKKIG